MFIHASLLPFLPYLLLGQTILEPGEDDPWKTSTSSGPLFYLGLHVMGFFKADTKKN